MPGRPWEPSGPPRPMQGQGTGQEGLGICHPMPGRGSFGQDPPPALTPRHLEATRPDGCPSTTFLGVLLGTLPARPPPPAPAPTHTGSGPAGQASLLTGLIFQAGISSQHRSKNLQNNRLSELQGC